MDQPNVNQLQNQYLSQGQFPGPGPGVGCGQPGMNQPGMNQPGMAQPGLPQPGPQGGMAQVLSWAWETYVYLAKAQSISIKKFQH